MFFRLFSFYGRIGRLSYFVHSLILIVLGATLIVVLAVAATTALYLAGGNSTSSALMGVIAGVAGAVPIVWSSFALAAKRLRDIGLEPILTLPALIAFSLFDGIVLTQFLQPSSIIPLERNTLIGVVVNAAFVLILLMWPSRMDQEQLASIYYPSLSVEPLRSSQQVARSNFGRRTVARDR